MKCGINAQIFLRYVDLAFTSVRVIEFVNY